MQKLTQGHRARKWQNVDSRKLGMAGSKAYVPCSHKACVHTICSQGDWSFQSFSDS